MIEKIKNLAKEHIDIIEEVLKNLEILKENEVIDLAKKYFEDAKYFYKKEDYINAFEAIIISWAYLDACLHFNFIRINEKYKNYFTV